MVAEARNARERRQLSSLQTRLDHQRATETRFKTYV
jgi:hypothetical protein